VCVCVCGVGGGKGSLPELEAPEGFFPSLIRSRALSIARNAFPGLCALYRYRSDEVAVFLQSALATA